MAAWFACPVIVGLDRGQYEVVCLVHGLRDGSEIPVMSLAAAHRVWTFHCNLRHRLGAKEARLADRVLAAGQMAADRCPRLRWAPSGFEPAQ